MSMLQVKNLPEDLHHALADRARSQGISMSEYVTRLLRRDLSRPSIAEWVASQRADPTAARHIDVVGAIDAGRAEHDPDERFPQEPGAGRPARP